MTLRSSSSTRLSSRPSSRVSLEAKCRAPPNPAQAHAIFARDDAGDLSRAKLEQAAASAWWFATTRGNEVAAFKQAPDLPYAQSSSAGEREPVPGPRNPSPALSPYRRGHHSHVWETASGGSYAGWRDSSSPTSMRSGSPSSPFAVRSAARAQLNEGAKGGPSAATFIHESRDSTSTPFFSNAGEWNGGRREIHDSKELTLVRPPSIVRPPTPLLEYSMESAAPEGFFAPSPKSFRRSNCLSPIPFTSTLGLQTRSGIRSPNHALFG